jgi:hypothetical protein
MLQLWNQLQQHPMVMSGLTLAAYHAASAFVGASGKFYRFFFQFANLFAANYSRSKASTGSAGEQPPKAN